MKSDAALRARLGSIRTGETSTITDEERAAHKNRKVAILEIELNKTGSLNRTVRSSQTYSVRLQRRLQFDFETWGSNNSYWVVGIGF